MQSLLPLNRRQATARPLLALFGVAMLGFATPQAAYAGDGAWFDQIIAGSKSGAHALSGSSRRAQRSSAGKANRFAAAEGTNARSNRTRRSREADGSAEPSRASLAGGGITWQANSGCVPGQLRGVLDEVIGTFGRVTVTSTCRGTGQNRAAGGAGQSYHLSGQAVDFRAHGSISAVYAQLSSNNSVGGLKHYGGGLFHIDTGPRRSW